MSIKPRNLFTESPYSTLPLEASETGLELMVGRDKLMDKLEGKIDFGKLHPTLEGPNGVGKTSLVAVTGYRMFRRFDRMTNPTLHLPMVERVPANQPTPNALHFRALLVIAKTLLHHESLFVDLGIKSLAFRELKRWVFDTENISRSGGVGVGFMQVDGGTTRELNTTEGFTEIGFETLVKQCLSEVFEHPSIEGGTIIGVIDNFERLETAYYACKMMEDIRDTTLNLPHVKWVVCGAQELLRVTLRSPQLNGYLGQPLRVEEVESEFVEELIRLRYTHFSTTKTYPGDDLMPISPSDFLSLYAALGKNLRETLAQAQEFFDEWILDPDLGLWTWFESTGEAALNSIKIGEKALAMFKLLAEQGGELADNDSTEMRAKRFGYTQASNFSAALSELSRQNLLQKSFSEADARRSNYTLTPLGWSAYYSLTHNPRNGRS